MIQWHTLPRLSMFDLDKLPTNIPILNHVVSMWIDMNLERGFPFTYDTQQINLKGIDECNTWSRFTRVIKWKKTCGAMNNKIWCNHMQPNIFQHPSQHNKNKLETIEGIIFPHKENFGFPFYISICSKCIHSQLNVLRSALNAFLWINSQTCWHPFGPTIILEELRICFKSSNILWRNCEPSQTPWWFNMFYE